MFRFYVLGVIFSALLGGQVPQPPAGAPKLATTGSGRILTLAQALNLAEQNHPQLQVAADRVTGASAGVTTARAFLNPEISFGSLGHQRAIQPGTLPGMLHGFTLSQTFELPALRRARISSAQLGRVATQFAYDEDRLTVRGMVKQAYFEALRRKNEIALARENLQLLQELQRRIKVQYDVGEASRLELTRADAEVSIAAVQAQSVERRYSTALADLHAAIGVPLDGSEPDAPLDPVAILPPLEELTNSVLAKHPGIAGAEIEERRADANVGLEKALRLPQPTGWIDVLQQPDVAQYRFGVAVTLPLWNQRKGPIAEAEASRRQSSSYSDFRRLQIATAVEKAYGEYRIAQSQVEMFESGVILQAEAAVQGAQAAFQFGERGIIEVLDAQRVLRSSRLEYINAQYDRQQALIVLEQLGALDPRSSNP